MTSPGDANQEHPRSFAGSARRRGQRQSSARRVYDLVRASIRRGDIAQGQPLVEDRLADELSASRQAVREALHALAQDGLVARRPRVGTTVSGETLDVAADQLMHLPQDAQQLKDSELERVDQLEMRAPHWIRERLQLPEGELVRVVEEIIRWRGEPVCVRVTYKPLSRLPAGRIERGVADLPSSFRHAYGLGLGAVQSAVEAVGADQMTASLLGTLPGAPMLVREVLLVGEDDLPRDLSYTHYRGDRICFTSEAHFHDVVAMKSSFTNSAAPHAV